MLRGGPWHEQTRRHHLREVRTSQAVWRKRLAPIDDRGTTLIARSRERLKRSRALLARTRQMLGMPVQHPADDA
jgi:hypothetical protein